MSSPLGVWQELLRSALLGTDRQSAPPTLAGALGELTRQLPPESRESAFLGTAAAVRLYQRAGQRPLRGSTEPPPAAPADSSATIGAAAVEHLRKMLGGDHAARLPEWLALVKSVGRRIHESVLVELLNRGTRDAELREHIVPVLGRRGVWLAGLNSEWSWATANPNASDLTVWETGAKPARKLFIRQLRKTDAAKARELIAAAFPQEAAEERADFVAVLDSGLSMADEPFLEGCLDDRADSVRTQARLLLGKLPTSRFCQRMFERVKSCLTLKKTPKSVKLELAPPETCDKAMVRDGLEPLDPKEKDAKAVESRRERWVVEMVAFAPPSHWVATLGRSPADILTLLRKHEWESQLFGSLCEAVVRHRDSAWVDALIADERCDDEVFGLLPPAQLEAICRARMAQDKPLQDVLSDDLLEKLPRPWSAEFSVEFLAAIASNATRKNAYYWWCTVLLETAGRAMPTSLAAEAEKVADGLQDVKGSYVEGWREQIRGVARTLRFRAELAAALKS